MRNDAYYDDTVRNGDGAQRTYPLRRILGEGKSCYPCVR